MANDNQRMLAFRASAAVEAVVERERQRLSRLTGGARVPLATAIISLVTAGARMRDGAAEPEPK